MKERLISYFGHPILELSLEKDHCANEIRKGNIPCECLVFKTAEQNLSGISVFSRYQDSQQFIPGGELYVIKKLLSVQRDGFSASSDQLFPDHFNPVPIPQELLTEDDLLP